MRGLLTLDHRVATDRLRDTRQTSSRDIGWSPRRRLASLVACVIASWLLVLGPVLIWG
jgi:hypothetical protein